MPDINGDEIGPVDYLVVGFPAEKANFSGEMASELKALIDSNTVRVLDLVMITRADDGSVEAAELRDADDSEVGELRALERDLAILLAEEDIEEVGASLEPGSAAAVLVWENTWAAPFASAVRRSGGELLGNGRIPTQALSRGRRRRIARPRRKEHEDGTVQRQSRSTPPTRPRPAS